MRSLLAPARLRALAIVGAIVTAFAVTQDSCTWLDFRDQDSVSQLSEARACELARRATGQGPDAPCGFVRATDHFADVMVRERRVCFLKAGRWFVVDANAPTECPTAPPLPPERVTSLRDEERLEAKWSEQVRRLRDERAQPELQAALEKAIASWRNATDVPTVCPPALGAGQVDAVDVDLVLRSAQAPWHYLSSDRVERLLAPGARYGVATELQEFTLTTPRLLFVNASEKKQPFHSAPGLFKAKVALIEWRSGEVLCEAEVGYEQDERAPHDPEAAAELMPDFKERVTEALRATTSAMTNGQLSLNDTW